MYRFLYNQYKISSFKKTASCINERLGNDPFNPDLLTEMAWIKYNLFKDEEALEYANKAEFLSPALPLLWYVKGVILRSKDDYEASIDYWNKILQEDFEVLASTLENKQIAMSLQNDAHFYKATCLYSMRHDAEALVLIREHVKSRRRGLESDFTVKEARNFLRILEFSVDNSNLQRLYHNMDKSVAIRGSAGYMTLLQRKNVEMHLRELKTQKEWSAIIIYLKRKCREFPNEYWLKTELAEYLYIQGNKTCLKYAKDAYRMAPDDMLAVYNYACALYLNEKYIEALKKLTIIKDKGVDYIAYSEHGEGMKWAKKLMNDAKKIYSAIKNLADCEGVLNFKSDETDSVLISK